MDRRNEPSPLPTKRPLAPLMLLMAACSSPALAEDAARKDDPLELGADTVTGEQASSRVERSASAKYAVPLLDTPQTVTVVPQKVIQEQNALSLRQVLSNVSGITFNAGEGGGGSGDSINIRGFSANANMQVDGLRDSAQTSRSDLFNLEAVEVIKGPNSVFGGAGTSGGSINMVSKQPKAEAFTHLGAGLGTDRYRRLTLDTNQPLEGLGESTAFRLNLMAHHNDVAGREQIDKQRWGIAPSLTFGLDTPTRLTLSYFHQRDDNLPDYGVPALNGRKLDGVSRHDYFGWRNLDEERIDNDVATLKLEHDFSDDFQLQNLIRYSHLHRDTVISASHVNQKGLPPGRYLPAGPQAYGRDSKTRMWINQTNLTGRFDTFGLAHTLIGASSCPARPTTAPPTPTTWASSTRPTASTCTTRRATGTAPPTSATARATGPNWRSRRCTPSTPSPWTSAGTSAWACATTGSTAPRGARPQASRRCAPTVPTAS